MPNLKPKLAMQPNRSSAPNAQALLPDHCTMEIGTLTIECSATDLKSLGKLGEGSFGYVEKMQHPRTGAVMAVKRITYTLNEEEQKKAKTDLEVNMQTRGCKYAVQFYGAMYREGDIWICMEVMDCSLDKFYKTVYENKRQFDEVILQALVYSVLKALLYLQKELRVMHRDVKPSNILVGRGGVFKICDYGISGQLVNSIAKTKNVGARPYMAPERIECGDVNTGESGFDVRSDVWSLGITVLEVATGEYPYSKCTSLFHQVEQIVRGPPPKLPADSPYSDALRDFCDKCLFKQREQRFTYDQLLMHSLLNDFDIDQSNAKVAAFVDHFIGLFTTPAAQNGCA